MPEAAETARAFRVHARHVDGHHARTLTEASFEAAALAYAEDIHPAGPEPEISVIVQDVASGHERCFRIDMESGEAGPCA